MSSGEHPKEYIITEAVFNHVVAALRDNRHYDVAEYLIHGSRPHQAQDDIDLEELGNQDIDPKIFEAYAKACDTGAQEQFLMEQIRKAREETYEKFLKEIRKEVPVALGYIDLDSIEAVYIRLIQKQAGEP